MNFQSKETMFMILQNKLYYEKIGAGSQGTCYHNKKTNEVYKIFDQYIYDDEYKILYNREELMRFSHIKNKTFLWAKDVISIDSEIVGYITNYKAAKPLYKINPLRINLNKFCNCINFVKNDIRIISENGIKIFDLMYNILYGSKFFVTDFDEFSYSDLESKKLEQINNRSFNYELYCFLIDGYFDEFINDYDILRKLYNENDADILYFINLFRKYLGEYVGNEIKTLNDAYKGLNKEKKKEFIYKRQLSI